MLDNLYHYTKKNGMQINADKTKAMIFNKSGKFFRRSFKFDNEQIFTTNSYKYLGFILTPSGEITSGLKDLNDKRRGPILNWRKQWDIIFDYTQV